MSTSPLHALPAFRAGFLDEVALEEELRRAARADWTLLALVACAALTTLLLALAVSLAR